MFIHAIVSVALVGVVYGAPNHLKHVSIEKQAVVNGGSANLGASASWGPFSAGARELEATNRCDFDELELADSSELDNAATNLCGTLLAEGYHLLDTTEDNIRVYSNPAGLGDSGAIAGAQAGSAGAGAGIGGGSTASASASASAGGATGSHVSGGGPTIFDQIFNIPISVLKAVNEHVNNKEVVPGAHMAHRRLRKCRRRGICPEEEGVSVHGSAGAGGAGAQASAHASAGAGTAVHGKEFSGASADAGAHAGSGSTLTVRKNYDNVFAIPISALTSVNQLLNGKK